MLEDTALIVPIEKIKKAALEWGRPISCDIEPNPSEGYLITPNEILEYVKRTV
jgi:hypothetical protein